MTSALIVAAGSSRRMGFNKLLAPLAGVPVLRRLNLRIDQDDRIALVTGSIDSAEVQQRIVSIMEGGAEAFEKRKQVYEAWKPKNF
jgi:CTP:molybdopterin cytidylyltransferase MocA